MNRIVINADLGRETINRHIYGHFAEHLGHCIYGGIWVGEDSPIPNTRGIRNDVVQALRYMGIPNLRWPGGCFADEYHWMDGIGPREERPTMVNTHWGGVTENNHFGTHEFMDLCEQLACEPYICGNVGSGTVQEMQQWVEYLTFDGISPMADLRRKNGRDEPWQVKYWGVGNENWGCGGSMRPEAYADEYRRFQTYVRSFGDNRIYKIAGGAPSYDFEWTEVLMQRALHNRGRRIMDGLSLHYYIPHGDLRKNIPALDFEEDLWFRLLRDAHRTDDLLSRHGAIMDRYDPNKEVGMIVDEWGAWYEVEEGTNPGFLYQQNTLRDALVASLTFDVFNRHCDRVHMANIAQTINVLQAVILTDQERMVLTPTYHVFEMYKVHQDATLLPMDLRCGEYTYGNDSMPMLSGTASRDESGRVHLSLTNVHPEEGQDVSCTLRGVDASQVDGRILTADAIGAHNTFDAPDVVAPTVFAGASLADSELSVRLPARSTVVLTIT